MVNKVVSLWTQCSKHTLIIIGNVVWIVQWSEHIPGRIRTVVWIAQCSKHFAGRIGNRCLECAMLQADSGRINFKTAVGLHNSSGIFE